MGRVLNREEWKNGKAKKGRRWNGVRNKEEGERNERKREKKGYGRIR